jgi:glyoxylase-like metal-dependent hydrolase (beta-lactamase superfamily II)
VQLVFEQIRAGGDRNFAYLIGDREAKVAVAVDPSFEPRRLHERATAQGLAIAAVLCTHGHPDHTHGVAELVALSGAREATPPLPLDPRWRLGAGRFEIRALHVPGHTEDHLLFWLPALKIALTGDFLFVGKVGGTSGEAAARAEWDSLQRLLRELPPDTTIWPGHDYGCRPSSTLALERLGNPFLRVPDFESFLRLKSDWPALKPRHGLV